jgi:hypothetical protein
MICPSCQKEIKNTAKFCKYCGTPVIHGAAPIAPEIPPGNVALNPPAPPPQNVNTPELEKYCSRGHKMDPSWLECPICIPESGLPGGTRLERQETPLGAKPSMQNAVALLVGVSGKFQGKNFPLCHGVNLIGSESSCQVVLDDSYVSRKHASIRIENGKIIITDLDSRNGTFVNNAPATHVELRDNDKIQISTGLVFRLRKVR